MGNEIDAEHYIVFDEVDDITDHDEVMPASDEPNGLHPIRMLIVDDEPEMHHVTRFALRNFRFNGQPLEYLSAYSASEAEQMLAANDDIALILLDVVMETDEAGLQLVRVIREDLRNTLVRIILRTGQPGQAPEHRIIVDYDINDYKSKDELTADRLMTAVHIAIRTYRQLQAIERSRRGLEKIVAASSSLFEQRSMSEFVQGVVWQIQSLVEYADGAMLCALAEPAADHDVHSLRVIAGTRQYESLGGHRVETVAPEAALPLIQKALASRTHCSGEAGSVFVFDTYSHTASLVYLHGRLPLHPIDRQLLEFFCGKVAIGFDNVYLFEQLSYSNRHDTLTGLLNRTTFLDLLNSRLRFLAERSDREEGEGIGVVVIGLDRFKDINQDLGYEVGDQVLAALAGRLRAWLDDEDVACRLVGDLFGLLMGVVESPVALAELCEDLRLALCQPLQVGNVEVIPTLSLGYTFVASDRDPAYVVLADAEQAMVSAKRFGGFRSEMAPPRHAVVPATSGRVGLLRDLSYALERDEFHLRYQPIVHSASRKLAGFEALLRWQHPIRGLVAPERFIDIAESTRLIVPIGNWVIRTALQQIRRWNELASDGGRFLLSVNVSARQLMTGELLDELTHWLDAAAVDPGLLKLEVTESLLMEDFERAEQMLARIKALGVQLALDDFGTGFSSLSYLHRFAFDSLKLDRIFVQSMLENRQTLQIVKSVIALAQSLNIETIAEGVETEAQAALLQGLGCDYFQGFLFGRPLAVEVATERVCEIGRRLAS